MVMRDRVHVPYASSSVSLGIARSVRGADDDVAHDGAIATANRDRSIDRDDDDWAARGVVRGRATRRDAAIDRV